MYQQAYDNENTALGQKGLTLNQAFQNALNGYGQQANIANQQYNIDANTLNALQGLYQGQHENDVNSMNAQGNLANAMFDQGGTGLNARTNLANQQTANLNNANQIGANLTQQTGTNTSNTLGAQSGLLGAIGDARNSALNAQTGIANQQMGNLNTMLGYQSGLTGNQMNALNGALNAGVGITNQQLGNNNNLINALSGLYGTEYGEWSGALGTHLNTYNQMLQNYLNAMNSNIFQNGIANSSNGISTSAAAQEAAQQPALNLWQASMGMSPAQSGAIQALSGRGQTTQTTSNGGGGFWSGMFAPMAAGLGQAAGTALIGAACFPAGTQISLKQGTKPIEEIREGDLIKNPMNSKELRILRVMKARNNHVYRVQTDQRKVLETTDSQPILTSYGQFIELKDLRVGDELALVGRIESIDYVGYERVYDFEASDENVFEAEGFIVEGGGNQYWKE